MDKVFSPELVAKSLRVCATVGNGCGDCIYKLRSDADQCYLDLRKIAADMIEAQAKRIEELEELVEDRTKDVLFYAEREKWIPSSERNPDRELEEEPKGEDGKPLLGGYECIALIEGAKRPTALWYCDLDGERVWTDETGETFYRVTHWKPMPKGPEAEA